MHIESARAAHTDAMVELLTQAFIADPVWSGIYPSEPIRRRNVAAIFTRQFAAGIAHVDVALADAAPGSNSDSPPRDAGAAWQPADCPVIGVMTHESPSGIGREQVGLLDRLWFLAWGARRRAATHQRAIDAYRPFEPHWYLHDIAAHPQHRGQGIGSAMLTHRLSIVDTEPAPVFLEATTAASRRLYERFGFRTVGTVSLLPGTNSSAMIRPARD